jgi:5-methylcytosine-specific restriction endonuclease McrA
MRITQKRLHKSRRYFCRRFKISDNGLSNSEIADKIEENIPGSRLESERSRAGSGAYIVRMYAEHYAKIPGFNPANRTRKASLGGVESDAFLISRAWRKLRYKAIVHYGAKCHCCGSAENIQVDHIKPRRKYPELALEFDNLQILCSACNQGKGNWDETDWRPSNLSTEDCLDIDALSDLRERGLLN